MPDVPRDQIVDFMVEKSQWIVVTPDDWIAGIERLQGLTCSFGKFMMWFEDWAPRDKIHRRYELLARYVMPHFQGTIAAPIASNKWAAERQETLVAGRVKALDRARQVYADRQS